MLPPGTGQVLDGCSRVTPAARAVGISPHQGADTFGPDRRGAQVIRSLCGHQPERLFFLPLEGAVAQGPVQLIAVAVAAPKLVQHQPTFLQL